MNKKPKYDALLIQDGAVTELIDPDGKRGLEFSKLSIVNRIEGDKVIMTISCPMKINLSHLKIDPNKITGITGLSD